MKLNKKTVFIAAAAIAIVLFLALPVVKIMGKASVTGSDLTFTLGSSLGYLFLLAPAAAIGLELKKPEFAKFAAWAMFLPALIMVTQSGCSPMIGWFLYVIAAGLMTALPYIKQIPEE